MMPIIKHVFGVRQRCSGPRAPHRDEGKSKADRDPVSRENCLEEVEPELSLIEPFCSGSSGLGQGVSSGGNNSNNNSYIRELWLSVTHPFDPPASPWGAGTALHIILQMRKTRSGELWEP